MYLIIYFFIYVTTQAGEALRQAQSKQAGYMGNGSVTVTRPIELVRELKWREKQKVVIRWRGGKE